MGIIFTVVRFYNLFTFKEKWNPSFRLAVVPLAYPLSALRTTRFCLTPPPLCFALSGELKARWGVMCGKRLEINRVCRQIRSWCFTYPKT